MKPIGTGGGILVILVALCACDTARTDSPKATSSAASARAAASAPTTPAAAATPAASSPQAGGCPYRRRCEAGCKKAHFAALEICKKESDAFFGSLDKKTLGECSANCLKIPNPGGCVGGSTKAECDCMIKCSDALPADLRKKGLVYVECYAKAVTADCD